MNRIGIVIVAALATVSVLAQDRPRRGGRQQRGERPAAGEHQMRGHGNMMQGAWVPRMLSSQVSLEKIGVTDEALRTKLLAELKPLKEQGELLERKLHEVSREQFQQMRALLKDKSADPKAVMDKIDEVAKLRAEQGRLSVRALVVLRDNLSPEQLEKARTLVMERGRERGMMRHGMRPGGERPTPPPDGSAPREKPFEAAK